MQNQNPQSEQNKLPKLLLLLAITIYLLMMSTTFVISSYLMLNPREGTQESIRDNIEKEVDRSYTRFFTQFNFAVFLIGTSVWVLRQSVINSLQTELKKQFKEEVEEDFNKDLKTLREGVKKDFEKELGSLKSDLAAQRQKDEIIQELSILIPRPDLFFQEQVKPGIQVALKKLTAELEELKSSNLNLCLTVEDCIKWGDGLYYSAWNSRSKAYSAWFHGTNKLRSLEDRQAIECYKKAIAQYEKAVSDQSNAYIAYLGMGNALRMSGQYKEAVTSCEKAIQDKNVSHIAWVNKGLALRRLYDGEKGLRDGINCFDEAIRTFPLYARAYYNRACYYARLNDITNTINSLEKAFEYAPAQCLEVAEGDDDFCSIKDHEQFKALVPNYSINCAVENG